MQRGYAFKLLACKDIASLLGVIGIHPAVTAETIEKPTVEATASMYQHLVQFAYDMEVQEVRARVPDIPAVLQYMEIFDEALDALAVFKFSRQLAVINRLDDFNLKDFWEPSPKRVRAVLSGMMNFARYKEAKTEVIRGMKEDVLELDANRIDMAGKCGQLGQELSEAHARHSAELPAMWAAENAAQEARAVVDKLTKQRQVADHVYDDAEAKREAVKARIASHEERITRLRSEMASLREQVAESPEGLEQEIQELHLGIREQKTRVEEKSDEKRARVQRVQVLGRLNSNLQAYREVLSKMGEVASQRAAACDRTRAAQDEQAALRRQLQARRGEESELAQSVQQITDEMDMAKQVHQEQVQNLEVRRQQALSQHQALQEKQTEEQRQVQRMQVQRLELEAEIASVRRAHEDEARELQGKIRSLSDDMAVYVQTVEGLLSQYDAEADVKGQPTGMDSTPGAAPAVGRYWHKTSPRRLLQ